MLPLPELLEALESFKSRFCRAMISSVVSPISSADLCLLLASTFVHELASTTNKDIIRANLTNRWLSGYFATFSIESTQWLPTAVEAKIRELDDIDRYLFYFDHAAELAVVRFFLLGVCMAVTSHLRFPASSQRWARRLPVAQLV